MRRSTAVALAIAGVAAGLALAAPASGGPEAAAADRCVQGGWRMSNAASNAFLRQLVPSSNISVAEGVLTAAFPRRGNMVYGSTHFVVKVEAGDMVMKGTGTFHFEAPWNTNRGKLVLGVGRSEMYISKLSATKDGRTITVNGPPPTVRRTPAGATPYTCRSSTLRWKVPLNDTWAVFHRAR